MRAFWSIDAAFALVLSVAMFAMFSALLFSAGKSAASSADAVSGEFLSARFSESALSSLKDGQAVDLQAVLAQTGQQYASLRMLGKEGDISFAEAGERGGEIFCTERIAMMDGKMVKMEACIG